MTKSVYLAAALAAAIGVIALPAAAEGNPKEGANVFKKRCFTCHAAEKGAKHKTGPTLFGVFGNKPALAQGYKYSKSYLEAGEKGLVWDEKALAEYVANPLAFIRKASGDAKGQSKMTFQLTKKDEIEDVIAFLKTQK